MNDRDPINKLFNDLKNINRTDSDRLKSLEKIRERFYKQTTSIFPIVLTGIVAVAIFFFMVSINDFSFIKTEEHSIVDEHTTEMIQEINVNDLLLVDYELDNMDRGNYEFMTQNTNKKIVIDPNAFNFKRGDILYFSTPFLKDGQKPNVDGLNNDPTITIKIPKHQISRIVGLPGEKIEIINGQVFIDDIKLDTFYAVATVKGKTKNEYLEKLFPNRSNLINFEENMDPIIIPKDSVFVLGDQWWRSIDSRYFGPLKIEKVKGKVLGYDGS